MNYKPISELEKMDYYELHKYRCLFKDAILNDKTKTAAYDLACAVPLPKSLQDLKHHEIQAMTLEEKELFKSEYRKQKTEILAKRAVEYHKLFVDTPIDWINKRLSHLYDIMPAETIYKAELSYLAEAKSTAISTVHKKNIDFWSKELKADRDTRFIMRILPDLWYTGAKHFVCTYIKKLGGVRYHKSGNSVKGSVYYRLPDNTGVRISDHVLPDTEQRQINLSNNIGGDWVDIVLDTPMLYSALKPKVLNLIEERLNDNVQCNVTAKLLSKLTELKNSNISNNQNNFKKCNTKISL